MTLAESCLLIACLLPLACAWLAKSKSYGKPRREGGFDNNNPRQWMASLEGWQARANAAQSNSFESLPLFLAGILLAERGSGAQSTIDAIAVAFVVTRAGYIAAYLADRATLRSLLWLLGMGASIALFFVG